MPAALQAAGRGRKRGGGGIGAATSGRGGMAVDLFASAKKGAICDKAGMRHSAILSVLPKIAFFVLFAVILVLALEPRPPAVGARWDKLNHMAAFFVLTASARVLWPRCSAVLLAVGMIAAGGAIELLQLWLPFGRDAEWMDWAADSFATIVGLAIGSVVLLVLPPGRAPEDAV